LALTLLLDLLAKLIKLEKSLPVELMFSIGAVCRLKEKHKITYTDISGYGASAQRHRNPR
jgi:hypothetical protein